MSLIPCPECSNPVSHDAKNCPKCGAVVARRGGNEVTRWILIAGVIALAVYVLAQRFG